LEDGNTVWLDDLPVGPIGGDYTPELPFSFRYGNRLSGVLLPTWDLKRSLRKLDEKRTEHSLTYTDLKTGLEARWVAVAYEDFPTVEWTLYFKNTSASPTPILENIQALNTQFARNGEGEFLLHHGKGSPNSPTDYQPFETLLEPRVEKRIGAAGGRPTDSDLSY